MHCIELVRRSRQQLNRRLGCVLLWNCRMTKSSVSMASEATKEIVGSVAYASTADFEHIFTEDMTGLYLLSLLLTGDLARAEECFVAGVGESTKAKHVFKEWARSWARRAIIRSAIRLVAPRQQFVRMMRNSVLHRDLNYVPLALEAEVYAILELAPFERFVFVMSVLQHYSEHDCSILLGCSRRDIAAALARALEELGGLMNFHKNEADAGSEGLSSLGRSRLVGEMTIARYFATPGWNPSVSQ